MKVKPELATVDNAFLKFDVKVHQVAFPFR